VFAHGGAAPSLPASCVDRVDPTLATRSSPRVRLRVAVSGDTLTRSLARGADPGTSPELALRARVVTGGAWSPLYNAAEPGSLRRLVLVATAALEPESATVGEFAHAA
jgi:hypothetical protein